MQGACLQPDKNPQGDWSRALVCHKAAAGLFAETGDKQQRGASLQNQGRCLQPDVNPGGDWAKALACYEEAAKLHAEAGDKRRQGASIHVQAFCRYHLDGRQKTPDVQALFRSAAELRRAGGDEKGAQASEAWLDRAPE